MRHPEAEGYYWAKWLSKASCTADPNDAPGGWWEIVEVIENCLDPNDPEHFGVFVTGVGAMQWLDNFEWGPSVACSNDPRKRL